MTDLLTMMVEFIDDAPSNCGAEGHAEFKLSDKCSDCKSLKAKAGALRAAIEAAESEQIKKPVYVVVSCPGCKIEFPVSIHRDFESPHEPAANLGHQSGSDSFIAQGGGTTYPDGRFEPAAKPGKEERT